MASFGIRGLSGTAIEHLIPFLTFFDSLKQTPNGLNTNVIKKKVCLLDLTRFLDAALWFIDLSQILFGLKVFILCLNTYWNYKNTFQRYRKTFVIFFSRPFTKEYSIFLELIKFISYVLY